MCRKRQALLSRKENLVLMVVSKYNINIKSINYKFSYNLYIGVFKLGEMIICF